MSLKVRTGLSWSEPSLHYRYEDEINKRTALENEFVLLKKVCGVAKPGEVALWLWGVKEDLKRIRVWFELSACSLPLLRM